MSMNTTWSKSAGISRLDGARLPLSSLTHKTLHRWYSLSAGRDWNNVQLILVSRSDLIFQINETG